MSKTKAWNLFQKDCSVNDLKLWPSKFAIKPDNVNIIMAWVMKIRPKIKNCRLYGKIEEKRNPGKKLKKNRNTFGLLKFIINPVKKKLSLELFLKYLFFLLGTFHSWNAIKINYAAPRSSIIRINWG